MLVRSSSSPSVNPNLIQHSQPNKLCPNIHHSSHPAAPAASVLFSSGSSVSSCSRSEANGKKVRARSACPKPSLRPREWRIVNVEFTSSTYLSPSSFKPAPWKSSGGFFVERNRMVNVECRIHVLRNPDLRNLIFDIQPSGALRPTRPTTKQIKRRVEANAPYHQTASGRADWPQSAMRV